MPANLQAAIRPKPERATKLKTGVVTGRDARGLIVRDDASSASVRISGSARIGQRVSYRYAALVSIIPAATVTVVSV